MRWMITDSGLGGLSVCAGFEIALTQTAFAEEIELLYVNATPDDRIGYNALKTQAERIELFNKFLVASVSRYEPDVIVIACNTLSVIYDQTTFARTTTLPVHGIVKTGVELCEQELADHPDHDLIIFATETTTEANTYPELIRAGASRIIPQECPELAHAISNDATGAAARSLLAEYSPVAAGKLRSNVKAALAYLGCTHYGYQSKIFEQTLSDAGIKARCLDPNQLLVKKLVSTLSPDASRPCKPPKIEFVSRYQIPAVEIASMESYLKGRAPHSLSALQKHAVIPDLFETLS